MTTVNVYRSTDASAPVLTGQVGTLIALLDACLVNGYGSQPAAGWTKPYAGTNKGVWKNSAVDGTGMCLYVDDTGSGGGGSREARACGFQTATGLGTGTGQFPTSSLLNIGNGAVIWRKSNTTDATARPWTLIADDTVFYLFMENGDYTSPSLPSACMFGDFFSYSPNDHSNCMIIGRNNENSNSCQSEWFPVRCGIPQSSYPVLQMTIPGHFVAANSMNVGGALPCGKHIDEVKAGGGGMTQSMSGQQTQGNSTPGNPMGNSYSYPSYAIPFPNPVDNGIHFCPVWVHHNGVVRGWLKGLWAPLQNLPVNHNDTFNGTGSMAGKAFLAQTLMGQYNGSAFPGLVFAETSSTWS